MNYRKPQELKLLTGAFRGDREQDDLRVESDLPEKLPTPSHLGSFGKKQWRKLVMLLEEDGLLKNIDLATLEACCMAYDDMIQGSHDMKRYKKELKQAEDDLKICSDGEEAKIILARINAFDGQLTRSKGKKDKSMVLFHKFMNEFGLSPGSRKRLAITEKREDESEFEKMFRKRNMSLA